MSHPALPLTPTATQIGDPEALRAEINELQVQRKELRQLKDFYEAEASRWKEEARVAKEEARYTKEELMRERDATVRGRGEIEKLSMLLGLWEDKASVLESELRIAEAGKTAAQAETTLMSKVLEEADAAWRAETLVLEEEIQHLLDLDGAAEADATQSVAQLRTLLEGACARLKVLEATKKELAAAEATVTELKKQLKKVKASSARRSQEATAIAAGLNAQLAESQKRAAAAEEDLRTCKVSARAYQLEIEKLKKNLGDTRKRAADDADRVDETTTKRRRTCEEGSSSHSKQLEALPEDEVRADMKRAFMACYKAVIDYKAPCGRICCEPLRKLPERAVNLRYFEVVKDPISLYQIQQRMNTGTYYQNVKSFRSDFYQLFDNARLYYDEGSQEYADAEKLEEVFMTAFIANISDTDMPGAAECSKA